MHVREFFFVCLALIIQFADSAPKIPKLPKNLIRCKITAPIEEINECLRKGIEDGHRKLKNGDPSINVDPFDPLTIPEISMAQSNGPVSIKIIQRNIKAVGLSNIQALKFNYNPDKKSLFGEFYTPKVIQTCDQTIDGRVLLLPISGTGKAVITSYGYKTNFTGYFTEYEKNGYHYWKFDEKTFSYKMNVEKMQFKFENLFNGDKTLGNAMNNVLNDNWKLVYSEVKPNIEATFGKILLNALNRFFGKVPLEEVFYK